MSKLDDKLKALKDLMKADDGTEAGSAPPPPPPTVPDVTQGGTKTLNSQMGSPFGKTQAEGHVVKDDISGKMFGKEAKPEELAGPQDFIEKKKRKSPRAHLRRNYHTEKAKGELFKDGWVVQARSTTGTPDMGTHVKTPKPKAPKASTTIVSSKGPSMSPMAFGKSEAFKEPGVGDLFKGKK